MRGNEVAILQETRTKVIRLTLDLAVEVLHHDGYSGERAIGGRGITFRRGRGLGFVACSLESWVNHRVELRIHPLHGSDRKIHQFGGRNLLGAKQFSLPHGIQSQRFGHVPTH